MSGKQESGKPLIYAMHVPMHVMEKTQTKMAGKTCDGKNPD